MSPTVIHVVLPIAIRYSLAEADTSVSSLIDQIITSLKTHKPEFLTFNRDVQHSAYLTSGQSAAIIEMNFSAFPPRGKSQVSLTGQIIAMLDRLPVKIMEFSTRRNKLHNRTISRIVMEIGDGDFVLACA